MTTAADAEAYGAAHRTADKGLLFHLCLCNAEVEATTWRLADTECVAKQVEREIYGITSNEQKRVKKELSIRLIELDAWWETIRIQALWKTIEQWARHFRNRKMHLVSHISESIQ